MAKNKISKTAFMKFWPTLQPMNRKKRCFWAFKKLKNNFIEADDFKAYMQVLLEKHPGLDFLKNTPEF